MKKFRIFKICFYLFFMVALFFGFAPFAHAKWLGLGTEDTWNDGLLQDFGDDNNFIMEKSSDGNPHLLLSFLDPTDSGFIYYYIHWNGSEWKGLDDESPYTRLPFLEGKFVIDVRFKVDVYDRVNIAYMRGNEELTVTELVYTHWDGEKWSGLNQENETDIISTQDYLETFTFDTDNLGRPHFIYRLWSQSRKYAYYVYFDGEKLTSFGDADSGKGLFPDMVDIHKYGGEKLIIDSKNFPHIAASFVPDETKTYSKMLLYTYWDGEKWTGINGSETGNWLPFSYHDNFPFYHYDFCLDKNNFPHFVYYADINGEKKIIYNRWDGNHWKGLSDKDKYTVFDWISLQLFPDFSINLDDSVNFHIMVIQEPFYSAIVYRYWDGSSWKGICGSDVFPGIKPDFSEFNGLQITKLYFFLNNVSKPIIGCNFYNLDIDIASVFRWQEEYEPTTELYILKKDYNLTEDNLKIHFRFNNPLQKDINVNLYAVLMDPDQNLYFFPLWDKNWNSTPLTLPAGFILPWTEIMSFDIPIDSPPINKAGAYYFGIFLQDHDTQQFISYDVKSFKVTSE
jgi:hypothetical protein